MGDSVVLEPGDEPVFQGKLQDPDCTHLPSPGWKTPTMVADR